jgi:hypothetical protein
MFKENDYLIIKEGKFELQVTVRQIIDHLLKPEPQDVDFSIENGELVINCKTRMNLKIPVEVARKVFCSDHQMSQLKYDQLLTEKQKKQA